MELGPSLNIITGETGAGKSILLGALGLIMGNRADTAALKDAGRNCVVEGVFDIEGYRLEEFFGANDLDYDASTVIRRVITPAGKSRAYVNDLPVQLSILKELSSKLIDIHSQHQSLMVASEGFRTGIVDAIAAESVLNEKYYTLYASLRANERDLARLRADAEKSRRDEEWLRHQHDQIAALKLREGEQSELEAEQSELANAVNIRTALNDAQSNMDDDEAGILVRLKSAEITLRNIAEVYPHAEELAARVRAALVELKDVEAEISSEADRIEDNPARLAAVDERLGSIYSLIQKHGTESSDGLMALQCDIAAKLDRISGCSEEIAALEKAIGEIRADATAEAAKITAARRKAAARLSEGVEKILDRLGIPAARFVCEITPLPDLSPSGADEIRFLFSANLNVAPQPLEKIASGGEISRVMLALKSLVARSAMLPTIIFDEIDTGVSGRIADAMGEIIAELAGAMQVVNITHLPQVASKGDTHFLVYKEETSAGTQSAIKLLTPEERITEIAKMLSGSTVTPAALTQARTLLKMQN